MYVFQTAGSIDVQQEDGFLDREEDVGMNRS